MKKKWIIIVIAVMLAACVALVALVACDSDTPTGNNSFVNPGDSLGVGFGRP